MQIMVGTRTDRISRMSNHHMEDVLMTRQHPVLSRRAAVLMGAAFLSAPMLARAQSRQLERLVIQTPPSGPGILMAHARATGAFDGMAAKVELPVWMGFDQMRAGFVSGDVPVTVMPTQGAASLYNRGFGLRMVSTLTDGHCGLIAHGIADCQMDDLRGKRIVLSGINGFTGNMMRLGLRHAGIALNEVDLIAAATHMEAGQVLLAGRADVGLIAEPAATGVLMRGQADGQPLERGVQMRHVLGHITGLRAVLPQACLAIRADYAAAHPWLSAALNDALSKAATTLNADQAVAAENAGAFMDRAPGLLERAIPFANIAVRPASEARPEIEALYRALLGADPGIIGGKLPDEGLYAL